MGQVSSQFGTKLAQVGPKLAKVGPKFVQVDAKMAQDRPDFVSLGDLSYILRPPRGVEADKEAQKVKPGMQQQIFEFYGNFTGK